MGVVFLLSIFYFLSTIISLMIIVDVESTGVDAKLCSLLSVGAVDFDNPTNQFYMECYAFPGAHIEKEALKVNGFKMEEIQRPQHQQGHTGSRFAQKGSPSSGHALALGVVRGLSSASHSKTSRAEDKEVVEAFLVWMKTCKEWTLAGQNPSFDRDFLQETAHRYHLDWPLAQRTIDLHSVAYYQFLKMGKEIPRKKNHSALNLDAILKHVGLPTRQGSHNALDDAKLEAEAFGRLLGGKSLMTEYSHFQVPAQLS